MLPARTRTGIGGGMARSANLHIEVMGEEGTVARFGIVMPVDGSDSELRERSWAAYQRASDIMRKGAGMSDTVKANSREHVERWLALEAAVQEVAAAVEDLIENGAYEAEDVERWGLPPDMIGKSIKDVGLAPQIAAEFTPKIEEYAERMNEVTPPSPDAIRDYMLTRLDERTARIEQLLLDR